MHDGPAKVVSVNDVNSPAQAAGAGERQAGPLLARPYMVVGELPALMAIPGGRGAGYLPVVQLIKDWNNQPESRQLMLVGGLPPGTDPTAAAKVAAVVHALCQRDNHPLPEWVPAARSPVAVALVPDVDLESPYGQRLRSDAPGVCGYHGVYFSVVDLRST